MWDGRVGPAVDVGEGVPRQLLRVGKIGNIHGHPGGQTENKHI